MQECRLIYRSVSTEEFVSNETLSHIIEKGSQNNQKRGITGMLILTGNEFLQVLEGGVAEINELYLKIAQDSRHTKLRLVSYELIFQRYFETWSMRLVDLWDLAGEKRNFLLSKYRSEDQTIVLPDNPMEIHSLLLDAKSLCIGQPWKTK